MLIPGKPSKPVFVRVVGMTLLEGKMTDCHCPHCDNDSFNSFLEEENALLKKQLKRIEEKLEETQKLYNSLKAAVNFKNGL
jgi:transcription initiation factor IIE alpha subunit